MALSGHPQGLPMWAARQIAQIGIMPLRRWPAGPFLMGGQKFVVTREVTRAEYLEAVRVQGWPVDAFAECPAEYRFFAISTD